MEYIENEKIIKQLQELFDAISEKENFSRINSFNPVTNVGVISESELLTEQEWLDKVQGWLDWAGVIPVYGDAVDAVNAMIYFIRAGISGKFMPNGLNGLLSTIGIIPVIGSAISIPTKAAFKTIPIKQASNIIFTLTKKSGDEAANLFYKAASSNTTSKIGDIINKNRSKIIEFFKGLLSTLKNFPVLGGFITIVESAITRILNFLLGLGKRTKNNVAKIGSGRLVLGVKQVPSNLLTMSGKRLKFKALNSSVDSAFKNMIPSVKRIGRTNSSKIFYATQDRFMSYLKKGGWKKMSKQESQSMLSQVMKNLDNKKLAGETIEQYAKRVGETKFWREYTNLSIINNHKMFTNYVNSTSTVNSFKSFMRVNFPKIDPKTYFDYFSIWTLGVKSGQAFGKSINKPSKEDYREKRRIDRNQKNMNKKNSDKKGGYYGTKREM
jgi:hypothetical protein